MIDLYYWTTPNGHKVTMFLEEAGIPYTLKGVNISTGEQFDADFLKLAPNNRIPAILDRDPADGGKPVSVFESGAILLYLAEKYGRFMPGPDDIRGRAKVQEWLMWQMGGLGPMCGQNHHFTIYAPEPMEYAIGRYVDETNRLYGVLDKQLRGRDFIAGDYSIADMAAYPWVVPHKRQGQHIDDFPDLKRWLMAIKARPSTLRAYARADDINPERSATVSDEAKKILFGQRAMKYTKDTE